MQNLVSTTAAAFAEALSALNIDPHGVEVSLSILDWKALDKQLAKENAEASSKASASPASLR